MPYYKLKTNRVLQIKKIYFYVKNYFFLLQISHPATPKVTGYCSSSLAATPPPLFPVRLPPPNIAVRLLRPLPSHVALASLGRLSLGRLSEQHRSREEAALAALAFMAGRVGICDQHVNVSY